MEEYTQVPLVVISPALVMFGGNGGIFFSFMRFFFVPAKVCLSLSYGKLIVVWVGRKGLASRVRRGPRGYLDRGYTSGYRGLQEER